MITVDKKSLKSLAQNNGKKPKLDWGKIFKFL